MPDPETNYFCKEWFILGSLIQSRISLKVKVINPPKVRISAIHLLSLSNTIVLLAFL